ncbi:alpha/beta hydrolase [bacterium]|nr:MAG: alpha/beta hydrolase [bacterium]
MRLRVSLLVLIAAALCAPALGSSRAVAATPQNVVLTAADGVRIYGVYVNAGPAAKATILLFHMARSNYGAYEPIIPALVAHGYNCLAIDQRSGAPDWGRENQTVAHLGNQPTAFLAALPDLDAALAWAHIHAPDRPIIAWGSSYSAALIFLLAARHPGEISALLAFSPGEYLGDGTTVHRAAAQVRVPIFVDSAADAWEEARAASILAASPSMHKVQYLPHYGVHGSSTLRVDADPRGAAENWSAVFAFLHAIESM